MNMGRIYLSKRQRYIVLKVHVSKRQ